MQCKKHNIDMPFTPPSTSKMDLNSIAMTPVKIPYLLDTKDRKIVHLRRRAAWFQRQIFGQKSERRLPDNAVLQTDSDSAYENYAGITGIPHAQCWAHSRRKVFGCRDLEPVHADHALNYNRALYTVEEQLHDKNWTWLAKRKHRQRHAKPILERFFSWIDQQFEKHGFLHSSRFLRALAYVRECRVGLSVYLNDPYVVIDTNHLERALRTIPMDKNILLFCWAELNVKHVGIAQPLIATCRLRDINAYD